MGPKSRPDLTKGGRADANPIQRPIIIKGMKVPVPTVQPHINNLLTNSTKIGMNDTKSAAVGGIKGIKSGLEPPTIGKSAKKVACVQCDKDGNEMSK